MFEAVTNEFSNQDVVIMAAAIADYTPLNYSDSKIKKKEGDLSISLKRTTDILAHLGENKTNQTLVGFALETNNELENAKGKMERKKLDFIILNSLNDKGAGFAGDTNKISIIDANNKVTQFELKSKFEVAADILNYLSQNH